MMGTLTRTQIKSQLSRCAVFGIASIIFFTAAIFFAVPLGGAYEADAHVTDFRFAGENCTADEYRFELPWFHSWRQLILREFNHMGSGLHFSIPQQLRAGTYNVDDVAAINDIISTNDLNLATAPTDGSSVPRTWTRCPVQGNGIEWSDAENDKRVTGIVLDSEGLTELPQLPEELETLSIRANSISELDLSNSPKLNELSFCFNPIESIVFCDDVILSFEIVGDGALVLAELDEFDQITFGVNRTTRASIFEGWEYDFIDSVEESSNTLSNFISFALPALGDLAELELSAYFTDDVDDDAMVEIYNDAAGTQILFEQPIGAENPFPVNVAVEVSRADAAAIEDMPLTSAEQYILASWEITVFDNCQQDYITDYSVFDDLSFDLTASHDLLLDEWDMSTFAVHYHDDGEFIGSFPHEICAEQLAITSIEHFSEYVLAASPLVLSDSGSDDGSDGAGGGSGAEIAPTLPNLNDNDTNMVTVGTKPAPGGGAGGGGGGGGGGSTGAANNSNSANTSIGTDEGSGSDSNEGADPDTNNDRDTDTGVEEENNERDPVRTTVENESDDSESIVVFAAILIAVLLAVAGVAAYMLYDKKNSDKAGTN
ncbi:MAG: hypothetical protein FWC81_04075 [Coriobacteriia bacterium]|nr:hypothetical protein [Coriobacteriia bacterium]